MNVLLTIAVLSLMLPLRMQTDLVLLRPFEFVVGLALLGFPLVAMQRGVRLPRGFVLLLPYFLWYLASATAGGVQLAAREGLQLVAVTGFAFLLAQEAPRLATRRMARRLLCGMGAIVLGTILWHVAHGYSVGWKRIPDPRLGFTFIPAVVAGLILFSEPRRRRALWFAWSFLFPLLLMSGERKAVVVWMILTALLLARGRFALIVPVAAASFVGLFLLSTMISTPYLQRQIHTLVDPTGTGNYQYFLATGSYLPGDTPSDVERSFAFHVSREMFDEHPLTGVGTNQYVRVLDETFPDLPDALRIGIHGEFQRVLTENGLIGLMLYLAIWAAAWVRLSRVLRAAITQGMVTGAQARILPLLLFLPFALYLGTEAPGSRAFVGIIIVSLLPEIARGAFAREGAPTAVRSKPEPVRWRASVPRAAS